MNESKDFVTKHISLVFCCYSRVFQPFLEVYSDHSLFTPHLDLSVCSSEHRNLTCEIVEDQGPRFDVIDSPEDDDPEPTSTFRAEVSPTKGHTLALLVSLLISIWFTATRWLPQTGASQLTSVCISP